MKSQATSSRLQAKQAAGKVTHNQHLEDEGIAQERKGEAQNLKGKVKGALGDKV